MDYKLFEKLSPKDRKKFPFHNVMFEMRNLISAVNKAIMKVIKHG